MQSTITKNSFLLVFYSYVLVLPVCYWYVSRMYSYVARMYPYVLVCYSYVLVWCFSHDPLLCPPPVALVIYLPIKVYTYALHIFTFNLSHEVARIFFFLQALAGIFFSSSIPCMNFFLDLTPPPPRISNGPPLTLKA